MMMITFLLVGDLQLLLKAAMIVILNHMLFYTVAVYPRMRGFGENVQQLISHLRFFNFVFLLSH